MRIEGDRVVSAGAERERFLRGNLGERGRMADDGPVETATVDFVRGWILSRARRDAENYGRRDGGRKRKQIKGKSLVGQSVWRREGRRTKESVAAR